MAVARRQSSQKPGRSTARNDGLSIADQVATMKSTLDRIEAALDIQFKRTAALQAQLDYLAAKVAER